MNSVYRTVLTLSVLFTTLKIQASELEIQNVFTAGNPAVAEEVNQNFSDVSIAVNDNFARIENIQASLSGIIDRISELESVQPGIVEFTKHYATDLFFMRNDAEGTFILPVAEDQQSESFIIQTDHEFYPVPGLDDISFNVASDDTVVIFQTTGEANAPSVWGGLSSLVVAIEINDIVPSLGAQQKIRMVSGSSLSGGLDGWNLSYPAVLDAGEYRLRVLVKTNPQNQDSLTIDGRSVGNGKGSVWMSITQIKMPSRPE
jgi:hypothetical protein